MAYVIEAIIAKTEVLESANIKQPIVNLPYGVGLIPLTEEVLQALGINRLLLDNFKEIIVDDELDSLGKSISKEGKTVAFIQANLFAGIGDQACVVWRDGRRIRLEISMEAINSAIEDIDDKIWSVKSDDEFDCLDLGKYRYTEEWVLASQKNESPDIENNVS